MPCPKAPEDVYVWRCHAPRHLRMSIFEMLDLTMCSSRRRSLILIFSILHPCVRSCVRACVYASERACARVRERASVRACERVSVCACEGVVCREWCAHRISSQRSRYCISPFLSVVRWILIFSYSSASSSFRLGGMDMCTDMCRRYLCRHVPGMRTGVCRLGLNM